MNRDNHFFGVLLGFVIPLLGVLMVYIIRCMPYEISFDTFLLRLKTNNRFFSSTLSLAMIAFIPLFTYYRNRRMYKTLYGIFIPVLLLSANGRIHTGLLLINFTEPFHNQSCPAMPAPHSRSVRRHSEREALRSLGHSNRSSESSLEGC